MVQYDNYKRDENYLYLYLGSKQVDKVKLSSVIGQFLKCNLYEDVKQTCYCGRELHKEV